MSIATYSDLQTSITNWLHRSDLSSVIPDFIALCEADVGRRLRHSSMEDNYTATITSEFTSLPTDLLEIRKIQLDTNPTSQLRYMAPQQMITGYGGTSGQPQFYAIVGNQLQVAPVPDGSYTLDIYYYAAIPALASNSTNWLLTAAPDVYLFGSLVWSAPYIQNDGRIAVWRSMYQEAVSNLQMSDQQKIHSGSVLEMRTDLNGTYL